MELINANALRRLIREELRSALAEALPLVAPAQQATQAPEQQAYTDRDLLRRWQRSATWLRDIRKQGGIKSTRFGSRWITSAAEVARVEAEGLPKLRRERRA
ncbi:hypothetical protein J5Y09_06730 [Roseomonas sp. PWR1]|uniref:Uncharacterized protein n=1 Tax=Roseomonas nitratireducens TaxID=2820810 RepID=A0ABS4AQG1_9PROT|nr:hypothetical protein [Neoroseomonas nitratireducens]MBP0463598.1 hypothetical protein [Neoroseomonas nitratireducens]